ncbi:protein of unknown function [Pararobbsia alpina]
MLGARITAPGTLILISEKTKASVFATLERPLNAAYRRIPELFFRAVKMTLWPICGYVWRANDWSSR